MTGEKLESAVSGVKIRYIGNKGKKTDNIAGTETVWDGFGDVQIVPLAAAAKLLVPRYAGIWQDASKPPPERNSPAKVIAGVLQTVKTHKDKMDSKPQRPANEYVDVPIPEILDAVYSLAEGESPLEHFGEDQRPKIESVRAKLGKYISQRQLTEAWDQALASAA